MTDPQNPTHIITDGWQGYNQLQLLGYEHTVAIHA